jgi:hypothetical protein
MYILCVHVTARPTSEMQMTDRLHILLPPAEKERYREIAEAQGLNLSDWVRRAVREAAELYGGGPGLRDTEELRRFFEASDRAHGPDSAPEPDWDEQLRLLARGKAEGAEDPR